jgi:hypothetical protein
MALLGFTDRIRSMRKSGSGLPALKIEIPDKKGLAVLIAVERAEELDETPFFGLRSRKLHEIPGWNRRLTSRNAVSGWLSKPHSELLVSAFPGRGSRSPSVNEIQPAAIASQKTAPWTYHRPAVMFGLPWHRLRKAADRVPNRRAGDPNAGNQGHRTQ